MQVVRYCHKQLYTKTRTGVDASILPSSRLSWYVWIRSEVWSIGVTDNKTRSVVFVVLVQHLKADLSLFLPPCFKVLMALATR